MVPHLKLFDSAFLSSLMDEFRSSMRTLLRDLCDDLETHYRRPVASLRLPVDYFRFVGDSLKPDDYSNWKVVGWIEELNDLLYFIDLHKQLLAERHPRAFAADLMAECQEKFYENSYQDDIFPRGKPEPAGLAPRLSRLCARLARQVTQESLFLVPGLPCLWLAQTRKGAKQLAWPLSCDLRASFERAELPGRVYVGLEGAYLEPPASIRKKLATVTSSASFLIGRDGIRLAVGRERFPLWSRECQPPWQWNYVPPCSLGSLGLSQMTLGAALLYRKDLTPSRIVLPQPGLEKRIRTALAVIERAWPEGARTLALLTSRIIPLDAKGVVSFSYRNRPGLSFINTFARDRFDLIDDLIHENSHHHLNLLLRKYDMKRGDRNQEIFYSPWRRSLRPLHGILHATFTFTMGAMLFERLATHADASETRGRGDAGTWRQYDVLRARFRCLEEVESVGYSIRDLTCAADQLGWLSPSGVALVRELARQIARVRRRIAPFRDQVLRSRYGPTLRRHVRTLAHARALYGLPRA